MPLAKRFLGIAGVAAFVSGAIGTSAFADSYSTQSITQYSTQNGYSTQTMVQTPDGTKTYGYTIPASQLNMGATFPPSLPPVNISVPVPAPIDINTGFAPQLTSESSSAETLSSESSSESISMPVSSESSVSSMASRPAEDNAGQVAALEQEIQSLQNRIADLESQLATLQQLLNNASSSSSSIAATTMYQAVLSGNQQVPPVTTSGSGLGTFQLNGDSLTYHISVQNLSGPITAAHFHLAPAGQNGAAIQPISFSGSTADGTWSGLTQNQIADLNSGNIYVNVHTANNPDGEIRGQITAQ